MKKKLSLGIGLLASVALLPLMAAAQDKGGTGFDVSDTPAASAPAEASGIPLANTGEITLGVDGISGTNATYGRYNGMRGAGAGEVGSWNIQRRDTWDSGKTNYLSFTGDNVDAGWDNMVLPEADIRLKIGQQGHWWVSGEYSSMTYTASNNFTSLMDDHGNLSPSYLAAITAAGAFVNNSTTANIPGDSYYGNAPYKPSGSTGIASSGGAHIALYGPQNELTSLVGTRRDKGAAAAGAEFGDWSFTVGVSHEHKKGNLEQAMTTGGSNTGFVTFPMPIDYDTDIYTASAAYNTRKLQAVFSYEMSNFIDNNGRGFQTQGWNFTNVYDPTTKTYTAYELSGVYSLPPSNQAHNATIQLAYNLSPTLRFNATGVYGLQFQNDPFPNATNNAYANNVGGVATHNNLAGAGPVPFGMNPASLNGFVETFFGSVGMYAHLNPKTDLHVTYNVDQRDPHTNPMWIYGDPTDALDNNKNIKYREAVPEGWTKQTGAITLGYRLAPETRLTLGYKFTEQDRTNAITHHTEDNEETAKLQTLFKGLVDVSLGYLHADRTASAPDYSLWLVQISSDCGSTLAALGCQQIPYYEAARAQDAFTGNISAPIGPKATFSLYGKYNINAYKDPVALYNGVTSPSVGVNRDTSLNIAPDLSYQLSEDNTAHVYYTFLKTTRNMRALNSGTVVGTGAYYTVDTNYQIHTAGIDLAHRVNKKLKVGLDYIYSYGNLGFTQSGGWTSGEAGQTYGGDPYLAVKSENHEVKVHATYAYSERLSMYLGYQFDSLDTTDWALVGQSVGQVLTGEIPPHYNVSSIRGAMTFKF